MLSRITPIFNLFFFIFFLGFTLHGQYTADQYILSTSGSFGSFTNNNTLSWTIGEVIIETGNQNNYQFTQGFHQPTPTCNLVFDFSDSLTYCGLDSVLIDVGSFESYMWSSGDTTQTLMANTNGNYTIQVTDSLGCSAIDSFQLFLHDIPFITANVFEYIDGTGGDVDLDVFQGNPPYYYDWSMDGTGDFDDLEDQFNLSPGTYQVIVIDENGCKDTIDVFITDEMAIFIPTGISPNADGVNDTWDIQGIDLLNDYEVKVLNRWGHVLYSAKNNFSPWDATYKGALVPTSDYYYVIEFISLKKVYTGTLTVKY